MHGHEVADHAGGDDGPVTQRGGNEYAAVEAGGRRYMK